MFALRRLLFIVIAGFVVSSVACAKASESDSASKTVPQSIGVAAVVDASRIDEVNDKPALIQRPAATTAATDPMLRTIAGPRSTDRRWQTS